MRSKDKEASLAVAVVVSGTAKKANNIIRVAAPVKSSTTAPTPSNKKRKADSSLAELSNTKIAKTYNNSPNSVHQTVEAQTLETSILASIAAQPVTAARPNAPHLNDGSASRLVNFTRSATSDATSTARMNRIIKENRKAQPKKAYALEESAAKGSGGDEDSEDERTAMRVVIGHQGRG